jgi:hypothetical protein
VEEEFARQHISYDHAAFVSDRAPGTDQEASSPTFRPHVGRWELVPPKRRQRSRNSTGVCHSLFEIIAIVQRDHIDPEEMLESDEIQPAAAAFKLLRRDDGLALKAILHQLPNLYCDLGTAAKNRFNRCGEPPIDGSLEQIGGYEENENHRHKGQTDICEYQLGAKATPKNTCPALDGQPNQISDENETEDEDEGDVEVPQYEQENPIGELFRR